MPDKQEKTLTSKVASNTVYQFVGKILGLIVGLITFAILTRYLGRDAFGQYSTIMAYLGFFAILADFGLFAITIREFADGKIEQSRLFRNVTALRLTLTVGFFVIGGAIAWFIPYPLVVKVGIWVGILSYLFLQQTSLYAAIFQYKFTAWKLAFSEVVGRIIFLAGVVLVVYLQAGLLSVMWVLVAGNLIALLINILFARRYVKVGFAFDFTIWKRILKLAVPLAAAIVLNIIYFHFDTIILSWFKPEADVGIYGAAFKVVDILVAFPAIITGLVLGTLTHFVNRNRERFRRVFRKTFELLLIISVPVVVGVILTAPKIIEVIAGGEYAESAFVLQIIILSIPFMFVGNLASQAFVAGERIKSLTLIFGVGAVLSLVSNFIAIPLYSYTGAAITTVGVEALVAVVAFILVGRYFKTWPPLKIWAPVIVATAVMGGVIWLVRDWNIFVIVVIAAIVYGGLLFVLRAITPGDVRRMLNIRSSDAG
ncbi:flippase [Patescibacteria group bacterium]